MGLANERRRYIVTPSLIGWAHIQNDPWFMEQCQHFKTLIPKHSPILKRMRCTHISVNWVTKWPGYKEETTPMLTLAEFLEEAFFIISKQWEVADSVNPSSWMTRTCLSCTVSWWPGDTGSQGIRSHHKDPVILNNPFSTSKGVTNAIGWDDGLSLL